METRERNQAMGFGSLRDACALLLLLALAMGGFAAAEDGAKAGGKTNNNGSGMAKPEDREPMGKKDWSFDESGKMVIKLNGYKQGDMVWLHKDGLDIGFWVDQDGNTVMVAFEEGKTGMLDIQESSFKDDKGNPVFKNDKEMLEKLIEKAKKELKKKKNKEKKEKGVSYDDPQPVAISVNLGFGFFGGDGCGHRSERACRTSCHGRR